MGGSAKVASVTSIEEWGTAQREYLDLCGRVARDIERHGRVWARATANLALRGPYRARLVEAAPGEAIAISNQEIASCDDAVVSALVALLDQMNKACAALHSAEEGEGSRSP